MTNQSEIYVANLLEQLPEIPSDSILSRTLYSDVQLKTVLFSFAAGEALSEHTAGTPAVIHILDGEGTLTIGDVVHPVGPGTWVHLPARQAHSLIAHTRLVMLLLLLRAGGETA